MEQKFGVKAVCLKFDPLCKNCKGSGNKLVRTNAIQILSVQCEQLART